MAPPSRRLHAQHIRHAERSYNFGQPYEDIVQWPRRRRRHRMSRRHPSWCSSIGTRSEPFVPSLAPSTGAGAFKIKGSPASRRPPRPTRRARGLQHGAFAACANAVKDAGGRGGCVGLLWRTACRHRDHGHRQGESQPGADRRQRALAAEPPPRRDSRPVGTSRLDPEKAPSEGAFPPLARCVGLVLNLHLRL